ncbi:MAG: BTAD domain-containing putative transcriptional regulator [Acidimicrobiales bacterium]
MEVRLLGPLEVADDQGQSIRLGGPKERALLAFLAVHANTAVSEDRLVDALWEDEPPRTAVRTLQSYLSSLRKALGAGSGVAIESTPGGCLLQLGPDVLDVGRARAHLERARSSADQGDQVDAALTLAQGLAIWRGAPLEEFAGQQWAVVEITRLEELRHTMVELRIDAELACGRHREVVGELEAICTAYPLRERAWAQRMTALYRCGRQAEALRAYQDLRKILGEELGIEPGPELARLEHAILVHDPALEAPLRDVPRLHLVPPVAETVPAPAVAASAPAEDAAPPAEERAAAAVDEELPAFDPYTTSGIVTLLFTDIAGSTEMLGRLGDDDYDELRRSHFKALVEAVRQSGGAEVKNLGDGLMAVFPSASDAVGCAVAMQQATQRHARRSGSKALAIRVGMHAGEPLRDSDDFFGTPVVVAKRLCDLAEPGQILVSRLLTELVRGRGGHEFSNVGEVALKGFSEPLAACAVRWSERGTRPLPVAVAGNRPGFFVGRHGELDELRAAWDEVQVGGRKVVLVAGEPGIGKTTLAAEVATAAHEQGAVVLFGRCDEESIVPFQPFVEALSEYARVTPAAELRAQLGGQAADLALLLPDLGKHLPELAGIAGTGAETERYRMFEAVPSLLRAISDDAPVVLMLDDMHWADRPTLHLFQHLIRRSTAVPMLVVGTYRDTDLVRTHPMAEMLAELRRADLVTRLPLRGLSAADVIRLVSGGNDPGPDDTSLGEVLWAETEGSPLFLREILRHLQESGGIRRSDDGRWQALRRIDQLGIPEGVREVIGRRLARLSEAANTALRNGSVQGRQLRLDVLGLTTDLSIDELLDALDEAVAAGVVEEVPGTAGQWAFTHALVRGALYEELSTTRRVRLHQRVGEAFEELYPSDPTPYLGQLAHHFAESAVAGTADKAIDYARRAGEHAMSMLAFEQAARDFAAALEIAEDAGHGSELRSDLLLAQGDAEWRAGDAVAARRTFERAASVIGRSDPDRLARAALGRAGAGVRPFWVTLGVVDEGSVRLLEEALEALPEGDSGIRAQVECCLARELYFALGAAERCEELSSSALAMARRLGDPAVLATVLSDRTLAVSRPDNVHERLEASREVVDIADALGDPHMLVVGWGHLFQAAIQLARSEDIARFFEEVDRRANVIGNDPAVVQLVQFTRSVVATHEGRLEDAESFATEAYRLVPTDPNALLFFASIMVFIRMLQGRLIEMLGATSEAEELFPGIRGTNTMLRAFAYATAGLVDEARAELEGFPIDAPGFGAPPIVMLLFGAALGRTCDIIGDARRAGILYDVLVPYDGQVSTSLGISLGPVDAILGRLAATMGRLDDAVRHFEEALSLCERAGWRAYRAETEVRFARLLAERGGPGDSERSRTLAESGSSLAAEIGMAAVLEEGLAILDSGRGATTTAPVSRLDRAKGRLTSRFRVGVARWTEGQSDDALQHRFSSAAAQRTLFSVVARSFQPSLAFGFSGSIVFELQPPADELDASAADWWTIEVKGRKATAHRGRTAGAATVVHCGVPDFVRLASGELHPARALLSGRATVEGDVVLALRIPDMFGAAEPLEAAQ